MRVVVPGCQGFNRHFRGYFLHVFQSHLHKIETVIIREEIVREESTQGYKEKQRGETGL